MLISLIISREINDNKEVLKKNISEIDLFIKKCIPENTVLQMGSILTGKFRIRMENLGYNFILKPQYRNTLYESNKEMINESDIVIIINLDQSLNMTDFEEYAKEQDGTNGAVHVLKLYSDEER